MVIISKTVGEGTLCCLILWFATSALFTLTAKATFYRPQRSWGKVMFSQAVCDSVNRGVVYLNACWDTTPPGADTPSPEETDTHTPPPRSRHPPGADTPHSRHPPLGADTPRGADTPPTGSMTPAYGQRAGGTHPTGMHSCLILWFGISALFTQRRQLFLLRSVYTYRLYPSVHHRHHLS